MIVGSQFEICFVLHFWCKQFWSSFLIFEKFAHHWSSKSLNFISLCLSTARTFHQYRESQPVWTQTYVLENIEIQYTLRSTSPLVLCNGLGNLNYWFNQKQRISFLQSGRLKCAKTACEMWIVGALYLGERYKNKNSHLD